MKQTQTKKIVTIGGGKGQAAVLSGLKNYEERIDISAIVSMVDDGGSTGRLSEELGIPPFGGDFKDVMTALSRDRTMVEIFQHRYEHGKDIKGHTVGNLILLGLLEQSEWDIPQAIELAKEILKINADIYPSTLERIALVAEYEDGSKVKGQDEIDNNFDNKYQTIKQLTIEPEGEAYEGAINAINEADAIVLCPGDLYGSLLCNLIVPGIRDAIKNTRAELVYITNLMTKVNQTHEWSASDFIREVEKYLPRRLDYAIVNDGELPNDVVGKEQYASENWEMVADDIENGELDGVKVIKDMIWYEGKEFRRISSDVIPRSFIRHDPQKIASLIVGAVKG
jgi:uncharacterized cofD-like protein